MGRDNWGEIILHQLGQIFTIPALWIWCSDLEPFTLPNFQELAPLVSSGSAFTIPKLTLTYLDMKLFLNFPWSKTKTWLRFVDDFGDKNTCDVIGSIVSTSVGKLSGCKPASDHVLEWKWKTLVLITHRLAYLCCQLFIMTFGNKYTKGNWFVIPLSHRDFRNWVTEMSDFSLLKNNAQLGTTL